MNTIVQSKAPLRRRVVRPLLGVLASLLLAATVNMIGIWLIGDVSGWSRWLHEHSGHFAVWRGLLYGATSFGWLWMRNRVLRREPSPEPRTRLLRAEIAAVFAVVTLEGVMFLQSR